MPKGGSRDLDINELVEPMRRRLELAQREALEQGCGMYAHAHKVLRASDAPLRDLLVWIEELGMHASLGGAPTEVVATIFAMRDKLKALILPKTGWTW